MKQEKLIIRIIPKHFCSFLIICFLLSCSSAIAAHISGADSSQQENRAQGLVGLLYDDTNLSRLESVWYIGCLNSAEVDWPDKNDFSAKLQGFIQFPVSGRIFISAEANNGILVKINQQTVLDAWENGLNTEGTIQVEKNRPYPIYIAYRQLNGPSYMRVYWRFGNNPREIIAKNALSYTANDEKLMQDAVNHYYHLSLEALDFDVDSIIDINQPEDVEQKRNLLVNVLFGKDGFPSSIVPDTVLQAIVDTDFSKLPNLARIDKLIFEMDWDLNSIVYHFIPKNSNNQVIIYHQGHAGKFINGINTIKTFLGAGYSVVAISMPLKGYNRKPIVHLNHLGKLLITRHEQIGFLAPTEGHPVRYFVEPVAGVVNYLMTHDFDRISMIGISGGGWTTTIYAAMDTRIAHSYPVAGSLPMYLRTRDLQKGGTFGDYEQYVPEIYNKVNYLEMYLLASYGENRKHYQILNQFDACCFGGTGYKTYIDILKQRMKNLGIGEYDFYLDSSHREHKISDPVLKIILDDLDKE